jgi:hypothetical protein
LFEIVERVFCVLCVARWLNLFVLLHCDVSILSEHPICQATPLETPAFENTCLQQVLPPSFDSRF